MTWAYVTATPLMWNPLVGRKSGKGRREVPYCSHSRPWIPRSRPTVATTTTASGTSPRLRVSRSSAQATTTPKPRSVIPAATGQGM